MPSKAKDVTELVEARHQALLAMNGMDPTSTEYHKTLEAVQTLTTLINTHVAEPVSMNSIVMAGGNIAVAVLVLAFESRHTLTTKLPQFLAKLR